MTKTELINVVAEKTGFSKKDSDKAVVAVIDAITEALTNGEKVQLVGFGTFEVKERGERKGINPRTKEEITIAASKLPSFKAGKALKDAVSKYSAIDGRGKHGGAVLTHLFLSRTFFGPGEGKGSMMVCGRRKGKKEEL